MPRFFRSRAALDLWALKVGTATTGGTHTVLFSAGINDEMDGLVGSINRASWHMSGRPTGRAGNRLAGRFRALSRDARPRFALPLWWPTGRG